MLWIDIHLRGSAQLSDIKRYLRQIQTSDAMMYLSGQNADGKPLLSSSLLHIHGMP